MMIDWTRFKQIVADHQRFLLTSHVRPDCDALGSELGMAAVLESLGKDATIVNPHATPPNLAFIDPLRKIGTLGDDAAAADMDGHEVLMVLDTSAWQQLGEMAGVVRSSGALKVVVDHHPSEDGLGAEMFKDINAESKGRLVVEAAEHLGVELTPAMAGPLFAAIATDSGWFRFGSTTGPTLRCVAKLIDAGAQPQSIYTELYEQDTLARLKLRGLILSRAQTEMDGRLVHTSVLSPDFEKTGALPIDTEDAINLTLAVKGVEAAVILVEQPGGGFKLSFRSRGKLDCRRLAEQYGGGGHFAAAGASVTGPLAEVQPKILAAVREALAATDAEP